MCLFSSSFGLRLEKGQQVPAHWLDFRHRLCCCNHRPSLLYVINTSVYTVRTCIVSPSFYFPRVGPYITLATEQWRQTQILMCVHSTADVYYKHIIYTQANMQKKTITRYTRSFHSSVGKKRLPLRLTLFVLFKCHNNFITKACMFTDRSTSSKSAGFMWELFKTRMNRYIVASQLDGCWYFHRSPDKWPIYFSLRFNNSFSPLFPTCLTHSSMSTCTNVKIYVINWRHVLDFNDVASMELDRGRMVQENVSRSRL